MSLDCYFSSLRKEYVDAEELILIRDDAAASRYPPSRSASFQSMGSRQRRTSSGSAHASAARSTSFEESLDGCPMPPGFPVRQESSELVLLSSSHWAGGATHDASFSGGVASSTTSRSGANLVDTDDDDGEIPSWRPRCLPGGASPVLNRFYDEVCPETRIGGSSSESAPGGNLFIIPRGSGRKALVPPTFPKRQISQ